MGRRAIPQGGTDVKPIARILDQNAKYADRLIGEKAQLRRRTFGELDVVTGEQAYTDSVTNVMVRSWPLSVREQIELASAGLDRVDARWTMRGKYADDIRSDDILTVGAFHYEVLASGVTRDEHGVEWTILTRRRTT